MALSNFERKRKVYIVMDGTFSLFKMASSPSKLSFHRLGKSSKRVSSNASAYAGINSDGIVVANPGTPRTRNR